jgi:pilus assembly protein Flp/PilA
MTMQVRNALRLDLKRFLREESGATAIEYALIAACVSIAIAGAVTGLGDTLVDSYYDKAAKALEDARH